MRLFHHYSGMDISKYKALYLQESGEHLSGIEQGLLSLEKNPGDTKTVDDLFRHYHSIKGMSASMGYEPIQKLAHRQEDLLDRVRQKTLALTDDMLSTLLVCLDGLKHMVRMVEEDRPPEMNIQPLLGKIQDAIDGKGPDEAGDAEGAPASSEVREGPEEKTPERSPELKLSHVMKVESAVFDGLLANLGDLFMVLSMFKRLSNESRSIELKDGVHMLGKTINTLHSSILGARMLPVEDLTASLPRVVRDIAKKNGKEVELKSEGTQISLDRAILEGLGSPLVHIIRNAVDHGIEGPGERVAAGKKSAGTITIRAYDRKDRAVIQVADDGRGIDVQKIRSRAISHGMNERKVHAMGDREALKLICLPGVSSADVVTDTSGRGVGMDVVKDAIEGLGGTLEIDSSHGKGTRVTMELPRTTSIIKALLVSVGGEQFLLPLSRIERVIEVEGFELYGDTYNTNGMDVPIIPLASLMSMEEGPEKAAYTLIIVENNAYSGEGDGTRDLLALKVDNFGAEMDAYIKPLLPPISRLWGISGIAILGSGRPVFLLDMQQIISRAKAKTS